MPSKKYEPQLKVVSRKLDTSETTSEETTPESTGLYSEQELIEMAFSNISQAVSNLSKKTDSVESNSLSDKICIWNKNQLHLICLDEIEHCHGYGDYTKFFFKDRSPILFSDSIGKAMQLLNSQKFLQPHKSWIINKNEVISFRFNMKELIMRSGAIIPVSRPNIDKLKRQYNLS